MQLFIISIRPFDTVITIDARENSLVLLTFLLSASPHRLVVIRFAWWESGQPDQEMFCFFWKWQRELDARCKQSFHNLLWGKRTTKKNTNTLKSKSRLLLSTRWWLLDDYGSSALLILPSRVTRPSGSLKLSTGARQSWTNNGPSISAFFPLSYI